MDKETLQKLLDEHSPTSLLVLDNTDGANPNQLWIDTNPGTKEVATYNTDSDIVYIHDKSFFPLFNIIGLLLSIEVNLEIQDV
ncbi:hypothetical protein VPHD518_0104 [Vibrio phage D518]